MSSLEDFSMPQVRRKFTVDFKRNAVSMVLEEKRPVPQVARELTISPKTLYSWIRQKNEGKLEGKIASGVDDTSMKLTALMAENQRLKAEVLLLKKFAAYLSKNGLE